MVLFMIASIVPEVPEFLTSWTTVPGIDRANAVEISCRDNRKVLVVSECFAMVPVSKESIGVCCSPFSMRERVVIYHYFLRLQ